MGPKLRARLAQMASMTPDELQTLRNDLVAAFDVLDDNSAPVEELREVADAIDSVDAESDGRNEAASLRSRVHPPVEELSTDEPPTPREVAEEADEDEDEDEDEEDEDEDDTREGADESHVAATEVATTASGRRPSLSEVQEATGGRTPAPTGQNRPRVSTHLVAAGDVRGFSSGQQIGTSMDLAVAMTRKLQSLGRAGTPDQVLVASLIKEYPEALQLGEDVLLNDERIKAVLGHDALAASGGICVQPTVDYTIDTIGSTARPLQAGLPHFNATRGAIKYTQNPTLADAQVPTIWTLEDDEAATPPATEPRKTCFRIDCQDPLEAEVYAIPVCLEVGNLMARFTPENIKAQSDLLDVAAARMAELELLKGIDAGSTATTSQGVLGTVRDILTTLDLINAGYRYRYRLEGSTLRNVLPVWVRDQCRADLAMELAHDNQPFAVTDQQVNAFFSSRNVSPIWMLEDMDGSFGSDQAAGALNPWPANFEMYVYPEGTWQYLDGGRIDLGVVRDSELNSRNDYQIWREDFEGLAKRGNESLKVTVTTKPTGMSAGTKDTSV